MRTVSWKDGRVVLVDQTRLPQHFELIETDDIERVALAIRRLEVRGAPAIGAQIPIEERDPDEVRKVNDSWITMPDANVLNYTFDVTPNELITAIVTEHGIARPPYGEAFGSSLNR
jgi:methylthioribose-1-phosphate isomerase